MRVWEKMEDKDSEPNPKKELLKPYSPSTSIELQELVPKIVGTLIKKFNKPNYGDACSSIDALVYVNLKDQHLATHSNMPNLDELEISKVGDQLVYYSLLLVLSCMQGLWLLISFVHWGQANT